MRIGQREGEASWRGHASAIICEHLVGVQTALDSTKRLHAVGECLPNIKIC